MANRHRRAYRAILVVSIVGLVAPQLAMATVVKLSGTMPAWGDVQDFQISPNGQYVVYRADQDTDGVYELYSVLLSGGTPVRLNGTLPTGSSVQSDYQISPDSSRVVYRADQDASDVIELYSVPIAGPASASVKLNGTLVEAGDVLGFQVSPDSSRVIYGADQEADRVAELYSVPLAGPAGDGVKLNGTLATDGDVVRPQVSPDSSRVVYLVSYNGSRVGAWTNQAADELYSVPLAGPAEVGIKLSGTLTAGGAIWDFQVSPDSSRVVYRADQEADDVIELYSVPIAGPASAGGKLNDTLATDGDVWSLQVSPDSSRVVYLADQDTDGIYELYSVPLAGPAGEGVKINGTLTPGGNVSWGFQISLNSSRVVYWADQDTDDVVELYSVPLAGPAGAGVKLNGTLTTGGDIWDFQVSPDSSRVVYLADQDTDNVVELYSVPLAGPAGEGVKLNETLVAGGVSDYQVSLDSSRVVYRADQDTDEVYELYSVPLAGPAGEGVKINGTLVAGGYVWDFQVGPNSGYVVYQADQDAVGVGELYWTDAGQFNNLYLPLVMRESGG